jgi:hypothetical protein
MASSRGASATAFFGGHDLEQGRHGPDPTLEVADPAWNIQIQ